MECAQALEQSEELTLEELKDRLVTQFDPDDLVEMLGLKSRDIVEAFEERVEEKYEMLIGELG